MNVTSALGWILGSTSSMSGAIDVVSVRKEDGSFTCSPFHVKLPVRASTKGGKIALRINGEAVKVSMRLGSAGEAFFIVKNNEERKESEILTGSDRISTRVQSLGIKKCLVAEGTSDISGHVVSEGALLRRNFSGSILQNINDEESRKASMQGGGQLGAGARVNTPDVTDVLSAAAVNSAEGVRREASLREGESASPRQATRRRFHSYADEPSAELCEAQSETQAHFSFPVLTQDNLLAIAQQEQREEERALESTWKWTWGDLPIKLTDPSIADLHSLTASVLKKSPDDRSAGSLPATCESGIPVEGSLDPTEVASVCGTGALTAPPDVDSTAMPHHVEGRPTTSCITRELEANNIEVMPSPVRLNKSTATAAEVAAALTAGDSNRILSLCAHILCSEADATEGLPATPAALHQVLLRHAVTEAQFAQTPVEIVTNPRLVVVVNDLLIPWRLVHAHLTALPPPGGHAAGDFGAIASSGGKYDMHNDRTVLWAGMNVNSWMLDNVPDRTIGQSGSGHNLHDNHLDSADVHNNNIDEDDYGHLECSSDRSSTIDNRTSLFSKDGEAFCVDESGELLDGAYSSYFAPQLSDGEDVARINIWSKESVDWNSATDLTKMRFHMFKSFNSGSNESIPDLLRPYVDAPSSDVADKADSKISAASDLHSISEVFATTSLLSSGKSPLAELTSAGSGEAHDSALPVLLQASRSHESVLNLLRRKAQDSVPLISTAAFPQSHLESDASASGDVLDLHLSEPVPDDDAVISLDDINPGPARGDVNDESDTESFYSLSFDEVESCPAVGPPVCADAGNTRRSRKYLYRKSLVPSQEQLKAMNLVNGQNEITFHMDGESPVQAHMYVWPPDAKVIVADIEGAVFVTTGGKSLGKLAMSLWGGSGGALKEAHEGLAQLFSNIAGNGYRFLYIATTPNASSKEDLLKSQHTSGAGLPLGPVFLPPDALVQTLGRERPDLYKAAALRGVRTLFGSQHNPYHAAFGAHAKDVVAFGRCGLPLGRTFLVNETGEITTVTSAAVKRSFSDMNSMLHEVFPTIGDFFSCEKVAAVANSSNAAEDAYGDFNFWRVPPKLLHL